MTLRVFISHASEDKERLVLKFADALRAKGIDAWLDKWEILPGDSLVDKIFEEGIKDAHAVIVVISSHSVNKPWVREELNAAVVKRINGLSKLIPVVIDDCQVPFEGVCVGHRADGREAARDRRGRARRDCLLVLLTGLAQMRVQIYEAGRDDEARRVEDLLRGDAGGQIVTKLLRGYVMRPPR
jgi:hypothetical protein